MRHVSVDSVVGDGNLRMAKIAGHGTTVPPPTTMSWIRTHTFTDGEEPETDVSHDPTGAHPTVVPANADDDGE